MSKRRQPQRLPPPILGGGEILDGTVVLEEIGGDLGMLLWRTARSARLWASLPEGERSRAFGEGAGRARAEEIAAAGIPPALAGPLAKAAAILQPRARSASVAAAFRELSDWALGRGALGSALELMQAAALVAGDDAELAHEVARLARMRCEYQRAETWYRQAISRARRTAAWHDFSRSYIGLGIVFVLRGSFPQARRSLLRGLRAARRFSMRPLVAAAYHELAVLGIQSDRSPDAIRYARLAVQAYGTGNARLPALAHDVGVFLLTSGYFAPALRIFQAVPAEFGRPVDRLARAAATARAAAALGDRETFESAWEATETLLQDPLTSSGAAMALVTLARAAGSMGELERGAAPAAQAIRLAEARGEMQLRFVAESVLDSLRSHEAPVGVESVQDAPRQIAGLVEELEDAIGAIQIA
jgi:tetratricopeptide (TPR) repeat protein